MIKLKRIYESASTEDGERFLVERLWARGLTKQAARLSGWLKDLAPSPALRQWFGHDPKRWAEFQKRYAAELQAPEKQKAIRELATKARRGTVTLVFAAKDTEHSSAVVLKRLIERQSTSKPSEWAAEEAGVVGRSTPRAGDTGGPRERTGRRRRKE